MPTITLLGKSEPVTVPTHYALLLELTTAYEEAREPAQRLAVAAAMIVICCPELSRMGRKAGLDYAAAGYSPAAFGREALNWLHGQRVPLAEIVTAGREIQPLLSAAAWPTDEEVGEALGKSAGPGAG